MCGYSPIKPKTTIEENNGEKLTRMKWICPRCGQTSRKETVHG